MKITMRNNLIGVEQLTKASKHSSYLALPEDSNSTGVIRYIGSEVTDLAVGMKIFFGDKRQIIMMDGSPILVMQQDNVVAIVEDHEDSEKTE